MSIDPRALLALVDDDDLLSECLRRRIGTVARTDTTVLLAEVRRRTGGGFQDEEGHAVVRVGGLVVDPVARLAEWRGEVYSLKPRPCQVLYALAYMRRQGRRRVIGSVLAGKVWPGWDTGLENLRVAVSGLRKEIPGLVAGGGFNREGYWLALGDVVDGYARRSA